MEKVTIWPFVITAIILGIFGIIYYFRYGRHSSFPEREVLEVPMPPCYSLNKQNHLLINGKLPGSIQDDEECEQVRRKILVTYESYVFSLRFSRQGEIYIRRQRGSNICWEKFGRQGENLGLVPKAKVRCLQETGEIGTTDILVTDTADGSFSALVNFVKL